MFRERPVEVYIMLCYSRGQAFLGRFTSEEQYRVAEFDLCSRSSYKVDTSWSVSHSNTDSIVWPLKHSTLTPKSILQELTTDCLYIFNCQDST
jgi:hypothetical protein